MAVVAIIVAGKAVSTTIVNKAVVAFGTADRAVVAAVVAVSVTGVAVSIAGVGSIVLEQL